MGRRVLMAGIFWMVLAQLLFVAAWTAIKMLGSRLPLFEIVFFRAFISLLALLLIAIMREKSIKGRNYAALFLRAIFGFIAMTLAFYAMIEMEMGNASTLFNTLPIFVALLAPPILGEAFSTRKLVIVFVAFAGIALILKPDAGIVQGASLFALLAGFLGALAMLSVRKLAATDSPLIITLYFTAFTAAASAPMAAMDFVPPTLPEWGWLVFIGVFLTFAQLALTSAFTFGHASTIAPFSYVSVIGAYAAGLLFFGEVPDALSIAGAAIIIGSGIAIMLSAPTSASREEIRSAKVT
jgi:drug/metabolite transporter (DMT)-like permease